MSLDTWASWRLGVVNWHNEDFFIDVNGGEDEWKTSPKYVWGECLEISTLLGRLRKIHINKKEEYIYGGDTQHEDFKFDWWRGFEKMTIVAKEYYFGILRT